MIVTAAEWAALMPSLIIIIAGLLVVGVDMFLTDRATGRLAAFGLAGAAVLGSGWLVLQRLLTGAAPVTGFAGSLILDDMASFLSLAILAATFLVLVVGQMDVARRRVPAGEFFGLLLLSASGMTLLVASADFLTIFLNLEILSIALYVLTGITRRNPRSNEAAVKYLVTGAFATGFLLLGIAFLYGASGTVHLKEMGAWLATNRPTPLFQTGVALVMVGFAFKIGSVPFHMWVPDVYEGAPTTTTMFMSVTVKAASVGALIRILLIAFPSHPELWAGLLWWMAVATMVVGNLLAIQQQSAKRMLAFSSVAHTGYALVALATLQSTDGKLVADGAWGALFYLLTYTFMTMGAFGVLIYVGHEAGSPGRAAEWQDAESLDDLAGLSTRRPWAAAAMTLFLISLGGVPPTAGFAGKLSLFSAAVAQGHYALAVIGVLASLVSMYYYLRIIVAMYMTDSLVEDERPVGVVGAVVAAAAFATVAIGIVPGPFIEWAQRSITQLGT